MYQVDGQKVRLSASERRHALGIERKYRPRRPEEHPEIRAICAAALKRERRNGHHKHRIPSHATADHHSMVARV